MHICCYCRSPLCLIFDSSVRDAASNTFFFLIILFFFPAHVSQLILCSIKASKTFPFRTALTFTFALYQWKKSGHDPASAAVVTHSALRDNRANTNSPRSVRCPPPPPPMTERVGGAGGPEAGSGGQQQRVF